MELVEKNRIIIWNDDNHANTVFFNGVQIGSFDDGLELLTEILKAKKNTNEVVGMTMWIFELNIDTEEEGDKICNFMSNARILTIAQERAILEERHKDLLELI